MLITECVFSLEHTLRRTVVFTKDLSMEDWIKKMRSIHSIEHYSAIKRNEIMPFAATGMDLEIVILSEVSQRRRNIVFQPLHVESKKK